MKHEISVWRTPVKKKKKNVNEKEKKNRNRLVKKAVVRHIHETGFIRILIDTADKYGIYNRQRFFTYDGRSFKGEERILP